MYVVIALTRRCSLYTAVVVPALASSPYCVRGVVCHRL